MKITKQKLISLIKEVISEQSTPPEIQKAVQSDAELETLLQVSFIFFHFILYFIDNLLATRYGF